VAALMTPDIEAFSSWSPGRSSAGQDRRLRLVEDVPASGSDIRRRRRFVVAVFFALLALSISIAALSAAGAALARTGGGPLTATGDPGSGARATQGASASQRVWVVRQGDTLWGIASQLEPGRDVRPLVDRLQAEIGSTSLVPGQTIALPSGS
jgi:LysM domain